MASTFFGLTIGTSGLFTANAGINTTAHNIANENTEGYSRQQATQSATSALRVYQSYGMVGSGVTVDKIEQVRDFYYDVKYWRNNASLGEQSIKNTYNLQMEDYFNEMKVEGFTAEYQNLFNSLTQLEGDPDNVTIRAEVLNYAQSLADYLNDIDTKLSQLQQECNTEVSNKVDQINTLASQIAALTKQISTVELTGAPANDLRDQRAVLVDELSLIVPVTVKEELNANNQLEFTIDVKGFNIVNNFDTHQLKVVTREEQVNDSDIVGLYDIYYNYDERLGTGTRFDVQAMGLSGELRGILDIRDGDNGEIIDYKGIPHYKERLGSFKEAFMELFNDVHDGGYNLYGDKTEGVDFYYIDGEGKLMVNEDLVHDPKLLGASDSVIHDGVGNSGIVSKWITFQDKTVLQNASAQEYLQSIVSELGVTTMKSSTLLSNYSHIENSISNQRLSVSGVDSDEEAMNLVKYQDAYELAAKVIQVMSEMYEKLINETGV
ncbi:MAG: flagellar hook-associated protein FlgK [Lachnospiraceae bacterium]|nr:flagellar hook-associated protein FlgK [Lachnospiraceae bacterium]MBQ4068823.1 flagellar hook-associated protein FlgK [Lachnospiraceae bacterium]